MVAFYTVGTIHTLFITSSYMYGNIQYKDAYARERIAMLPTYETALRYLFSLGKRGAELTTYLVIGLSSYF